MAQSFDSILSWAAILEWVSVAFAVAYLALAIPQSLWCWPAALISTAAWMIVAYDARLYMDSALQVFYFAMGIYGWLQWRRGGARREGVHVHWWPARVHLLVVATVLVAGVAGAWLLRRTDAAFPLLDTMTTVAAVFATFMVARKVIENWIYWFVIDAVYIYLYLDRGLFAYAGLYALYLVMVVFAFAAWLKDYRSGCAEPQAHGVG